jgi:hypothetical protein
MSLKRPFYLLVSTMKPLFSTIAQAISATSEVCFLHNWNLSQILQEKNSCLLLSLVADGLSTQSQGVELELAASEQISLEERLPR